MFKAPIFKIAEDTAVLRSTARINDLAKIALLHGHKMELVPGIDVRVGHTRFSNFSWNTWLRDAYLALNRLPDDDVEAHHIKGMLTKAVDMFAGKIPFEAQEYSVTMTIQKKLEDWEADVLAGKVDPDAPLRANVTGAELASGITSYFNEEENPLRMRFRLDVSRDIGIVPMQELQRALASLPFDIQLTTPTERATVFDKTPSLAKMAIEIIPAEHPMDFHRFHVTYEFDKPVNNPLARALIVERMQERKITGHIAWQDDMLHITASCAETDTLAEAIKWRCKVEEELLEVLSGLTLTPNGLVSLKVMA